MAGRSRLWGPSDPGRGVAGSRGSVAGMPAGRIPLHLEQNKQPLRRWRAGALNRHTEMTVAVGRLADQRFYAWHSRMGDAWVAATEADAQKIADDWLTDGQQWHPIPAVFDAHGQPADGGSWVGHGQTWLPADPSS